MNPRAAEAGAAGPAATAEPPAQTGTLAFAVLLLLIMALHFAPLVGLVGFRLTGVDDWTLSGASRDALAALLLVLAGVALVGGGAAPMSVAARWALAMVAAYGVLALANTGGLVLTALNLRRMVLVPLLFVAVLALPWTGRQIDALFRVLVATSAAVALFGIAEVLLPPAFWTEWLEIEAFTAANNLDRFGHLPFADSGRYYTSDLAFLVGGEVRRMISTYLEPTTLAAAMSLLLALALARRARGFPSTGLIVLAVLAGMATLSKGFIVYVLMLLGWRAVGFPAPRHLVLVLLAGCALALAAARLSLEGPLEHIEGLATALQTLLAGQWRGEGIGAAGNLSDLGSEVGEESGLGNVIGQVGVVAGLSLLWLRALMRDTLAAAAARRDPGGPWLASWLLFWGVTYLFSASSLGVGGNALGFIALALYLHPASGPRGA
jgi:hypothetical protein